MHSLITKSSKENEDNKHQVTLNYAYIEYDFETQMAFVP